MSSWRKLLRQMADDPKPVNYRYEDAARVLRHLGFACAPSSGGSHRHWRGHAPDGSLVVIGLKDAGNGPMKAVYVKDMVSTLRGAGMLPATDADV
jgi:hypothetical protein